MDNELKQQTSGKEKHHGHGNDEIVAADDRIAEIEIMQQITFYDRIMLVMEKFASTRMGQMAIEKTDRVLKVIEDTAKWSLPQEKTEVKLERPLPWIFFIPLIVWLRVFRIWMTAASFVVGSRRSTPYSMVYYIQTKRRRLRAIRIRGLKAIRKREFESTVAYSSDQNNSFSKKLRKVFNRAICKPGQHREVPVRHVIAQVINSGKAGSKRSTKRARDEDIIDLNLTVDQMLDKYANEDSDNDSDYIPKEQDEDEQSSNTSTSTADEVEKEDPQPTNDIQNEISETANNTKTDEKVKANGDEIYKSKLKTLQKNKIEYHSLTDSENDVMASPKDYANANGNGNMEEKQINDMPAATTEVAPPTAVSTPTQHKTLLTVTQLEENQKKSTPGHESAALVTPSIATATKSVPLIPIPAKVEDKSYRTITTQTAIELDWTITIKTEITHKKPYPKLEKINCSVELTPASSAEDIFYSPTGSPDELHSIFQPAPLVKSDKGEDFHSSQHFCEQRW